MSFADTLDQAFKARLPLLYIETSEEVRALEEITRAAQALRRPREVWTWTSATGLIGPDGKGVNNTTTPSRALDHIITIPENAVFVFCDLHAYFGSEQRPGDPVIVRKVRETVLELRHADAARALIVTAPVRAIPPELDKLSHLLEFPLPNTTELAAMLDAMIENNTSGGGRIRVEADAKTLESLVQAARGLTMSEAENAFARAMVNDGHLTSSDITVVLDEKRQIVSKSGLLDFVTKALDLDSVGGLNNLKRWLSRRNGSWLAEAEEFGLPSPKGVLITGVPGCGKSLTAKAMAASWGLPLLRLDIGRIFSGLVGSSEQNLRNALATAEAVSPCILWVDEIEKGFSNTTGSGDSGTTARVFGYFLTWMQEKKHPVFVVATANNIDSLPPEFMRKGRFDEIFFVDLPTAVERRAIWRIQLASNATEHNGLSALGPQAVDTLVAASENYSGAEIEQAVIVALYEAFAERRQVSVDDLVEAVTNMIPLAVTQAEEVQSIRAWAEVRAVRATGSEDIDADEDALVGAGDSVGAGLSSRRGGRTVDF
ncbi:AAA family ATPase [Mycetocola zhujimingii]|uniref:AAA family ATPase n=1 Tax=Mycetocola zhujimingii TaxID=2079792 RepID=UPI000D38F49D|nr:AAA family ATPase [Mycetocola zhujimingii]AWB87596.1 ATPase [Mycetocola zhujimingii]